MNMEEKEIKKDLAITDATSNAVQVIKTAILQSQQRALKAINQEQLALYYGIGRYVSANTRNKNWGMGIIEAISEQLRKELPGLKGFSAPSLRKMRTSYEEWRIFSDNSFVETNKLENKGKNFVAVKAHSLSTHAGCLRRARCAWPTGGWQGVSGRGCSSCNGGRNG